MGIVIHATRATREWRPVGVRPGDRTYHVLSDLAGEVGSRELRAFTEALGFSWRWVQYPGTYREHFDAPSEDYDEIVASGATPISTSDLGRLLAAKRAVMGDLPPGMRRR
jgi:uncharacterized protein DUF4031